MTDNLAQGSALTVWTDSALSVQNNNTLHTLFAPPYPLDIVLSLTEIVATELLSETVFTLKPLLGLPLFSTTR